MQKEFLPTTEIASSLGVKPSTMSRGLCVNGHYLGMKPRKLPNGRLLWPKAERDRLLGQASDQDAA